MSWSGGVQTGKVATVALLLASGVGAGLYFLYNTALAAVGALVPAEALKNNPMATSRSTSG